MIAEPNEPLGMRVQELERDDHSCMQYLPRMVSVRTGGEDELYDNLRRNALRHVERALAKSARGPLPRLELG